jgi:hypothetical protein
MTNNFLVFSYLKGSLCLENKNKVCLPNKDFTTFNRQPLSYLLSAVSQHDESDEENDTGAHVAAWATTVKQ